MSKREFLSFILDDEEYAVPILDVREVRGWSDVRPIPRAPEYLLGVWEIRGEYIPIVDLRRRFDLSAATISVTTVVIILNDAQRNPLGIIVDAVSEVYALNEENIKGVSKSVPISDRYIQGITQTENGHLIIIDIPSLFCDTDFVKKQAEGLIT